MLYIFVVLKQLVVLGMSQQLSLRIDLIFENKPIGLTVNIKTIVFNDCEFSCKQVVIYRFSFGDIELQF
ncbi:hypothetical protein D3C76_1853960 [compost metagenome]